jgi:hypothetical protein
MGNSFNWDDHPVVSSTPAAAPATPGAFNWDDHPVVQPPEPIAKRLTRSAIDAVVPVVGAIAGGAAGTPEAPGPGTVIGGGLGYAAGKHTAKLLDHYILGDPLESKGVGGTVMQTAKDTGEGILFELGGKALSEVPGVARAGVAKANGAVKKLLGSGIEYTPKPDAAQIKGAADALGLQVPKAVLTDNPTFQKLESGLSQSGSLPAKGVRNQYNEFFKGVDKAGEKVENLKTTQSDFAIGSLIKGDLAEQVEKSTAPVTEMYSKLSPQMKKIEVNEAVVNKAFGALKRNPIFQTQQGKAAAEEIQDAVKGIGDLNSLKEFRSTLHKSLPKGASALDHERVDAIYDAVTSVRDNTINALKDGRSAPGGKYDQLIDQITHADAAHSSNVNEINAVKSLLGTREFKSPSAMLDKLSEMKESDLAQRAANLDVTSMRALKEKFPSVFEKAQVAKINDMISSSMNAKGFEVNRFMKQYDSLGQETKDLLFAKDIQQHIENLKTVKQAIPAKLGPSGTPEGQMMMDMLNPKRNALDLGIKTVLDTASAPAPAAAAQVVAPGLNKTAKVLQLVKGAATSAPPAAAPLAAVAQQPTKGPDKWANDGFDKLIAHAKDDKTKQMLAKARADLMASPRMKELLIKASDLKPGTQAMADVMAKIRGGK